MKKYFMVLPLLAAAAAGLLVWQRELWFDEALTLTNFMLPLKLEEIYFNYTIPNNQIVYTMLLKVWDMAYLGYIDIIAHWRLLSLAGALLAWVVVLALRYKLDEKRIYPAVLVLSAVSASAVFMNYATALRGYGVSWLWIALALAGLYNICHKYRFAGWLLYFVAAVLAVGTVPTNMLALTAAACYAVPWMMDKFWKDWRVYMVFAVIMLAMIVFYAPILPQLAGVARLGEGFSSRMGAAVVTLGMYAACFGLLLVFAVLPGGIKPRGYYVRYLAWVLPLGAVFVLHRAPFPRVFVTMLPVLIMLAADGIDALTREKWGNFQKTIFYLTILSAQILLIPGGYLAAEKLKFSRYEDDFFHPWYMLPRYKVTDSVELLRTQYPGREVFLSFDSDPVPVLFYAAVNGVERRFFADIPYRSVKELRKGSLLFLRKKEDTYALEKRFNGKLKKVAETSSHDIYELD